MRAWSKADNIAALHFVSCPVYVRARHDPYRRSLAAKIYEASLHGCSLLSEAPCVGHADEKCTVSQQHLKVSIGFDVSTG